MEASAKGTLMDCEGCNELLADFLLDELPESEAVLVHEHLLICPACMKAYRDLKGTGKALEAVPAMRPVEGSEDFRSDVRKNARIEADKIVSKLPPDRRLRLEARREARQSMRLSRRQPPPKVWSPGLLILALAAALVLAAILFWPSGEKPGPRVRVATLSVALGKVDQFYIEANKPYTQVSEGKSVLPGENFKTDDASRARFDIAEGGSVFLGPASDVTFRVPQTESAAFGLRMQNGELGLLRPDIPLAAGGKIRDWEIETPAGTLTLYTGAGSTHAYLRVVKGEKVSTLEVSVLTGALKVSTQNGHATEPVHAGQHASLVSTDTAFSSDPESLSDERPPAWRADVVTDADLAALFSGKARIVSRKPGHLQIELTYNHEARNADWVAETGGATLDEKGGALRCPSGVRWKHTAPFAPPLLLEFKLNADSNRDANFEFTLDSTAGVVDVNMSKQATLQVKEKGKYPAQDHVDARNQLGAGERLVLQIKPESSAMAASLSTTSGKTKLLPLWKEHTMLPMDLTFQAFFDGILLDEIKVSGTLPVDWIRKKMSGAPDE
ncbi:MAG TPA: zf-HC2 domain-containing protein [Planctomycetota bacterium]|nr:zf-HC2 domain-containing protein [Planctomycetota bacterium]